MPSGPTACSEAERVLLRALASPLDEEVFQRAVEALEAEPEFFAAISIAHMVEPLRLRSSHDPMEALEAGPWPDDAGRHFDERG